MLILWVVYAKWQLLLWIHKNSEKKLSLILSQIIYTSNIPQVYRPYKSFTVRSRDYNGT